MVHKGGIEIIEDLYLKASKRFPAMYGHLLEQEKSLEDLTAEGEVDKFLGLYNACWEGECTIEGPAFRKLMEVIGGGNKK